MLTRDMCCCCTVARGRWTVRRLDYPSKRLQPYWVATTVGESDKGDDDREWVMFDTWAEAFAYADRKARGRA